jgi:hypothetical protein
MEKKINLNSIIFNSLITRENILQYVTQEEIYSHYLNEKIDQLGVFHSPLREDNIPSFALYFHKIDRNIIMFKDFATGDCGDFVILVMKMFNLSYSEALKKVAFDMGLSEFNVEAKQTASYTKIMQKDSVQLGIKKREWQQQDKNYWSGFGVKKANL